MYELYYGLKELPFNITPDPRFIFFSRHHQEALSTLLYGIESRRGFIQITGEIGAGKTTLSRTLLRKLQGKVHSALIFNPKMSEIELLQTIVEDFGILPKGKRRKDYFDSLNRFLLEENEKGFNAIVIIDEAQLLSPKALEQIRLLSNLEKPDQKLLQIILVGQPELKELLNKPQLRQLKQRITIRYHLPELSRDEVAFYLSHRLRVAGGDRELFTDEAVDLIYKISGGIPRIINVIADRSLLAGFTQNATMVDLSLVECAQTDLEGVYA
ncbi:General secretion pathway protein A [sediment metagenome]|uniref:General secretion pathway protein A n=1 Tax=sediment metagenome TaxID=749907 RepID=D9PFU3_9ZZZZ